MLCFKYSFAVALVSQVTVSGRTSSLHLEIKMRLIISYNAYNVTCELNVHRPKQSGRHSAHDILNIFSCVIKYIFLCENCWIFTQISPKGLKQQYIIIGSDNGLTPYRRQAIIWTNAGRVDWRIYAPFVYPMSSRLHCKLGPGTNTNKHETHYCIFKMAAASSAFHVWNDEWLLGELNLLYSYELILH